MNAITELGKVAQLLNIEQQDDLKHYESVLSNTPIAKRRKEGLTMHPVHIASTGFGLGSYPFLVVQRNPGDTYVHQFSSGTPVSLFGEDDQDAISGTVVRASANELKISFYKDELPDWVHSDRIGVNVLFDTHTYKTMMLALNEVINAEKGRLKTLREVILNERAAGFEPVHPFTLPELNESQNAAVKHVLEAQEVAVIHGPPGTGKTTTLVACAHQLIKREKQIMVCAASNAAVDNLALRLHEKGLKVVRVGNLAKVNEALLSCTLGAQIKDSPEFKQITDFRKRAIEFKRIASSYKRNFGSDERAQRKLSYAEARSLQQQARDTEDYVVDRILNEAQVVACTLIGSAHGFLKDRTFKTVLIDEAGQALEPACWVPMLKCEKVVLAGDPLQLPPTVKSQEAAQKGLTTTLLEKRVERTDQHVLLRTQYRMNEGIMAFSNKAFYEGKLEAHPSVANHSIGDDSVPLSFIDTAGTGYEEELGEATLSRCNPEEARLALRVLDSLELGDHSVGVISPYRAQVDALKDLLKGRKNTVVQTVDAFQGQECDVIVISLVRSNEKGIIGFLTDYRRMNVAMTRARKKLIVIGDSATIGQDKFYAQFLEHVEEVGGYDSAWGYMEG